MPIIPTLMAAVFMSTLAMRMTDPLVPILTLEFGVQPGDIALFATAYAIPYGLFQLVLGPLGDRFGKTAVVKTALFLLGLTILTSAAAPSYGIMVATRALSGGAAGGIISLSLATVGDLAPLDRRQVVLSRVLLAAIGGQITGALVTGILAGFLSWHGIFVVYALACFAIVGLLMLAPAVKPVAGASTSFAAAFGRYGVIIAKPVARVLLATVFVEGLLFYGFIGQMPAYLAQIRGNSSAEIGAVIAGYGLGGALYSAVLPRLLRIIDGYGIMRFGGLVAMAAISLSLLSLGPVAYGSLMLLIGYAFYSIHVGLQIRASELDPGARGTSMSILSATLFMGNGIGPWLLGVAIADVGYNASFVTTGLAVLVLAIVGALMLKRIDATTP